MLKKLSLKFTAYAVAALFIAELVMLALINGLNVYGQLSKSLEAIETIHENKGRLPMHADGVRPPDGKKKEFGGSENSVHYFTAVADENGRVLSLDTAHAESLTSEQAEDYAETALSQEESEGFLDGYSYRYKITQRKDGRTLIVFYDFRSSARQIMLSLEVSTITAVILLVLLSLMILLFSKRAVKPIIENQEKQIRFITDAGHELKTPLAVIRADAEVIEMTGGGSEWTQSILNQTDRLSALVERMLMLARAQEISRSRFEKINLSTLVRKTAEGFVTYSKAQNKPLIINVEENIFCMGEPLMLETLVSSLIENAVKYGSEESEITVSLSLSRHTALLGVRNMCDEPPSCDPELLFDRFYRSDSSRTRQTGGSGIGLSIARSAAEAHNAKLSCRIDGKLVEFLMKIAAENV